METYTAEIYDVGGKYMSAVSNAITGFTADEIKTQARLAGGDAVMIQSKDTLEKKYFISVRGLSDRFLSWQKVAPGEFLERIGQA